MNRLRSRTKEAPQGPGSSDPEKITLLMSDRRCGAFFIFAQFSKVSAPASPNRVSNLELCYGSENELASFI